MPLLETRYAPQPRALPAGPGPALRPPPSRAPALEGAPRVLPAAVPGARAARRDPPRRRARRGDPAHLLRLRAAGATAGAMARVLEHNRLDVLSLAALAALACQWVEGGHAEDPRDVYCLARVLERASLYERSGGAVPPPPRPGPGSGAGRRRCCDWPRARRRRARWRRRWPTGRRRPRAADWSRPARAGPAPRAPQP